MKLIIKIFILSLLINFNIETEKIELLEISPVEDLMREHGVLNRILLIYDFYINKLEMHESPDLNILLNAVDILKSFIEDYHERLEEEHIFPIFKQANKKVRLVKILDKQHHAGRKITLEIKEILLNKDMENFKNTKRLVSLLKKFVRMYRPHEAREDTELFPLLHTLVTEEKYQKLGDLFEKIETEKFGQNGFENIVNKIAEIEKNLRIYNLEQFTPKLEK